MAVPGRNRTLFRCVLLRLKRCNAERPLRAGLIHSYALCKFMNTWRVYTTRMSPTPNRSSALQCFQRGYALEILNRIMFDSYPGLTHIGMGCLYLSGWGIYHLMGGAFMADWVGHLWLNGGAFISLNWQGIYHLMGGHLWPKWVGQLWQCKAAVSFGNMLKKLLVFRRVPFPIITWPQVLVPLNSRPVDYYREGGTTPHLSLVLFEEPSSLLAFKVLWIYSS